MKERVLAQQMSDQAWMAAESWTDRIHELAYKDGPIDEEEDLDPAKFALHLVLGEVYLRRANRENVTSD